MTRVNSSISKRKFHKRILRENKGYAGAHSRLFRVACQEQMRSLSSSYLGRKEKKKDLRSLWIKQINIIGRKYNKNYNQIVYYLKQNSISVNKKILAKLAIHDFNVFLHLIKG